MSTGGPGNDLLDGGPGISEVIDGGAGNDTVTYSRSPRSVSIDLRLGLSYDGAVFDQLISIENAIGSSFDDTFQGQTGLTNRFEGGAGTDTISYAASSQAASIDLGTQLTYDGTAFDILDSIENAIGSNFNDTLQGQIGLTNRLDGGAGVDTISYAASNRAVSIDLGLGLTYDGSAFDVLVSIENAVGSNFDDTFQGDAGSNRFNGGAGSDVVSYAASTRAVSIDLAASLTYDGAVFDYLSSIENAIGSSFDDNLQGDSRDNVLDGGAGGTDIINGGAGNDTVSYATSTRAVSINLATQSTTDGVAADKLSSIENAIGSQFNDTLQGDAGDNALNGGAGGADTINGGAGNDTVSYATSLRGVSIDLGAQLTYDGLDADRLSSIENAIGSRFDDLIQGSQGDNVLDGGNGGIDQIFGYGGSDTVSYASSTRAVSIDLGSQATYDGLDLDTLQSIENAVGSAFNDTLQGSADNNVLDGGTGGADAFYGQAGNDTVSYAHSVSSVSIDLRAQLAYDGTDLDTLSSIENAIGSYFADTLQGSAEANVLDGGVGNDLVSYIGSLSAVVVDLAGRTAFDGQVTDTLLNIERVEGSTFDDIIGGDAGSNVLDGGAGTDTVTYATSARGVSIDLGRQLTSDGLVLDQLVSIENAVGSTFNDVFQGSDGQNRLDGGLGSDTVSYAASNRAVSIDLGSRLTYDGVSADTLVSIENAIGSSFNDTLQGDAGDNVLDGGRGGSDIIFGNAGSDTVSYASSVGAVTINLASQMASDGPETDTLSSIENAIGSAFDDTLISSDGVNRLDGGAGNDTASYAASSHAVTFDFQYATAFDGVVTDTFASIEGIEGSNFDDMIFSQATAFSRGIRSYTLSLDGGAGSDTVSYAKVSYENTVSSSGLTIDLALGRAFGSVSIISSVSNTLSDIENVIGSRAGDTITGDAGDNVLDGGPGSFFFIGGSSGAGSKDTLTGNAGNDTFRFNRGEANGDVVTDFSGNGAGLGDVLEFRGFGTAAQGATLTQIDATHYSVNSADSQAHETITLSNGAALHPSDYIFV